MSRTHTHTVVVMDLSRAAYDEIAGKLREAGYESAFDGELIDMTGIGVVPPVFVQPVSKGEHMTTRTIPRNPEHGKPTYARLLTGQTVYHAAYDTTIEIPPGTRVTVIAVVEQSKHQQFYGRYDAGSIPTMVICPLSEVEHCEPETIAERNQRGMVAVQFLQGLAGLKETDETAMKGWLQMGSAEQKYTLAIADRIRYQKDKQVQQLAAEVRAVTAERGSGGR